ncbi:hypothetical protein CH267_00955 [Rhodococcus sp. 06-621-2]|nr:head-tail adaptor protein [Rhodococcus sp. 06-621-2]OZC62142.1 hypothetical protein CH267_00955 [Rhodococcus sp. 06-621-2]
MRAGFTSTVEIMRPDVVTRDQYQNDVADWESATIVAVPDPVSMQTGSQSETGSTEYRSTVTTQYRLFTLPGIDLDLVETDRVRWAGRVFEVIEISRWPHPMILNGVHHVEVQLQEVKG